jgi:hypothetical protein
MNAEIAIDFIGLPIIAGAAVIEKHDAIHIVKRSVGREKQHALGLIAIGKSARGKSNSRLC